MPAPKPHPPFPFTLPGPWVHLARGLWLLLVWVPGRCGKLLPLALELLFSPPVFIHGDVVGGDLDGRWWAAEHGGLGCVGVVEVRGGGG